MCYFKASDSGLITQFIHNLLVYDLEKISQTFYEVVIKFSYQ